MAHNLLFNDALAEFELIDAVNEAFLRDKVANAVHWLALYGHGSVLARVEYILETKHLEFAQDNKAWNANILMKLVRSYQLLWVI